MKNKFFKVLSLVVVMALMLGALGFAAEEKTALFTIEDISDVNVGDKISLAVMLESSAELNSIGVLRIEYNKKLLKFNGFSEHDEIDKLAIFKTWDAEKGSVTLGLQESKTFNEADGKICNIEFEALKPGETTITAKVVAKNNSEVIETNLLGGKVSILGEVNPEDLEPEEEPEVDLKEDSEEEPEYTAEERAKDVICLKIDEDRAFAFGEMRSIDENNDKVVPYIYNDRTLVPLRFVSETLGADVLWEDSWNYCYVNKGDKKIKITFNSADIEVNGEIITYDAPIQVVEERTMVPIRFISETLGYHVHWNEPNKAVVITPLDNPWDKERQAEETLLTSILVTYLIF